MKKRHNQEKQAPSKVLLICVYDTVIIEVTNQIIFARFSPFGPIVKILIFQKGEVTKFFLEYFTLDDAVKAKNFLDGSKLYESICKMNIYYSNFSSVDLKHETTEGVSLQSLAYQPAPSYYYYPQPSYYGYQCYYNAGQPDEYTDLTHNLQNLSIAPERPCINFFTPSPQENMGNIAHDGGQNLQQTIESNIDWLLRSEQKKNNSNKQIQLQRQPQINEKSPYLQFELKQDLLNRHIYNLFSNFGNVSYIKKTKKSVYIKFRSVEFAAMAKNYLQGYTLLENYLDLTYVVNVAEAEPKEEEYSEITYFDASFDRFTPQRSITINPPGSTLHVSSLRRQACRVDNLKYIFEQFGPVQAVQILGTNYDRSMALVKFQNMEDSFYAMAQMHNKAIQSRKIQISFTKSKVY